MPGPDVTVNPLALNLLGVIRTVDWPQWGGQDRQIVKGSVMFRDCSKQPLSAAGAESHVLDRRRFLTVQAGLMTGAAAMLTGAMHPGLRQPTLAFQDASP